MKSASSRYTLYSTIERLQAGKIAHEQSPLNELTPRELKVLSQIARARSNYKIATALVLSVGTVKMHVSNILSKLHLADRMQAAIYALQLANNYWLGLGCITRQDVTNNMQRDVGDAAYMDAEFTDAFR